MSDIPNSDDYRIEDAEKYYADMETFTRQRLPILKLGGWCHPFGEGGKGIAVSLVLAGDGQLKINESPIDRIFILPKDDESFYAMMYTLSTEPDAPEWFKARMRASFGGQDQPSP